MFEFNFRRRNEREKDTTPPFKRVSDDGPTAEDLMNMPADEFEQWMLNRQKERHIPDNNVVKAKIIIGGILVTSVALPALKLMDSISSLQL